MDNNCCNNIHGKRKEETNQNLIVRLNKIEGQIRGIKGMIEKGAYCDDILTQMSAVQSAINSASQVLLESHLNTCIAPRIKEGDSEVIAELLNTIKRMMR